MNPIKWMPARVNPVRRHPAEQRLSLDGEWRFRLDPDDAGLRQNWPRRPDLFTAPIQVPGCWQGQGFGGEGDDVVWDFQFHARVFRATYKGTGWYGRTFTVPDNWRGRRLWLNFGGAHPSADVWLNGSPLGANDMPFVPFAFDITGAVRPQGANDLVVRVHERHREFGFCFSFQGNWSGLYRGVDLTATGDRFLETFAILPDVDSETLRVRAALGGAAAAVAGGGLSLRVVAQPADGTGPAVATEQPVSGGAGEAILRIPHPQLWSPDAPRLYHVDAELRRGDEILDALSERTGFVKLATAGKQFLINGEPYFLRGSADFVACPETGSPDTDRERWRRKLKVMRDYGYNYIRCQSYAYNPEYFDVADEVGLLIQSEMGMLGAWGGMSPMHVYQWPKPTPENYPVLKRQWDLVVRRDAHHPSANIYCMSNEYATPHFPRIAWQCYHDTKALKPTALVIWTDGGHSDLMPEDFVNWEGEKDKDCAKPLIQHEFRWWSSFPDVRLKARYNGAIRPYGAEIAEAAARRQGQARLLEPYAINSQRLQFLEAKAKMENVRRDYPRLAGICHFSAMDANPSPQGVFDEFYEKKYADSALWRETNGDTVILASLGFEDRCWTAGETRRVRFFISDFAHPPFARPRLAWRLTAEGQELAGGVLECDPVPYCAAPAGEAVIALPPRTCPARALLEARLTSGKRTVANRWDVWLFPAELPLPAHVAVYGAPRHTWLKDWPDLAALDAGRPGAARVALAERLDEPLLAFMRAGGRVILAAGEGLVRPHPPNFGFVKYFFTPPANYAPYEDGQNGTIIAEHPMLGAFPHEGFADWQFFRLIDNAPPLDLGPLDLTDDPVIRAIHRYPILHPLGYLVERACGAGGLILCALELKPDVIEARCLLRELCVYAADPAFRPATPLAETTQALLLEMGKLP